MQKITFVLENFYPEHRAGTETYVLSLAKGLIAENWQVSVIIAAVGKKSYFYNFNEIKVYAISVPEKISVKELNGINEPSNLKEFGNILKQIKPDIVHFHSFSRSFTRFHLKKAYDLGTKVFFTAHLGGIFCARGDLLLFGKKQCNAKIKIYRCSACFASAKYSKSKAVLGAITASVISKTALIYKFPALNLIPNKLQSMQYLAKYTHQCIAIAHWIEKAFFINKIEQTKVLTQAIDTSKFTVAGSKSVNQKLKIGFVGRMNPSKGILILFDALSKYNLYEKINLEIITIKDKSEIEFYSKMKQKFKELNYSKWNENITHKEINIIMDSWDLLVFPSFYEVAPLTILETYAKKIPVIGSDYPAIAEMIDDNKTGLIFKNGDSDDLFKKLNLLLRNRQLLDSFRINIPKVKDISELVEQYLKLYSYFV